VRWGESSVATDAAEYRTAEEVSDIGLHLMEIQSYEDAIGDSEGLEIAKAIFKTVYYSTIPFAVDLAICEAENGTTTTETDFGGSNGQIVDGAFADVIDAGFDAEWSHIKFGVAKPNGGDGPNNGWVLQTSNDITKYCKRWLSTGFDAIDGYDNSSRLFMLSEVFVGQSNTVQMHTYLIVDYYTTRDNRHLKAVIP
jgi:hypothetical protein